MKNLALVLLLMSLGLLTACTTSKQPLMATEINCPLYLQAEPQTEPQAPSDAFIDEQSKLFMAGEYFPWAKSNFEKLKQAREWCLK